MLHGLMVGAPVLCPCGSGKPYRGCHAPPPTAEEIGKAALEAIKRKLRDEAAWHQVFGAVPPPKSVKVGPHRLVQVGNNLHSFNGRTFHEFLLAYLDDRLGVDWLASQSRKPASAAHPLFRWRKAVRSFKRRHTKPGALINSAIGEGVVPHYFRLAHDVFTLQHIGLLEDLLLKRLKHKDSFQGARYEIEIAAGCRRAGFDVVLEDETDVTRSHCEFAIRHPSTGRWFSVEVKSRHREGVMGVKGRFKRKAIRKDDVAQLVIRALRKTADHQRLVFVDLNAPAKTYGDSPPEMVKVLEQTLVDLKDRENPDAPWPPTILIFTNRPHHFARIGESDCREFVMGGTLNMQPIHLGGKVEPGTAPATAWPEILLAESMSRHVVPAAFGFETDQSIFNG
jgi:hypothetical protein